MPPEMPLPEMPLPEMPRTRSRPCLQRAPITSEWQAAEMCERVARRAYRLDVSNVVAVRDAYLARLGLVPEAPSIEALFSIHRAHVERVANDTDFRVRLEAARLLRA